MRKRIYVIIFLWIITALCWVFVFALKYANRTVFVYTDNLESMPGIHVLDANNPYFRVTLKEPNEVAVNWAGKRVEMKKPECRVSRLGGALAYVQGQLNEDKEYPVLFDSGFSQHALVSDTVVQDAGLDIYPVKGLGGTIGGLCHLGRLRIGDLTIVNPPCAYTLAHYEERRFRRAPLKEKKIWLGLRLMKQFRYILFDNVSREVEFSIKESFKPSDPNQWRHFVTTIKSYGPAGEKLMVDIPVAGHPRRVYFDTGAGSALVVAEDVWETIESELTVLRRSRKKINMMDGFESCEEVIVEKLVVGETTRSCEKVHILDNESRWGKELFLLGIGFFQETVIVLDFTSELLWIKKPTPTPSPVPLTAS